VGRNRSRGSRDQSRAEEIARISPGDVSLISRVPTLQAVVDSFLSAQPPLGIAVLRRPQ